MDYRSSEYAIAKVFELVKVLLAVENRELGVTEIAEVAGLSYRATQKYVSTLEKLGLVEVVPKERKNVVRLTERGRCVARCLVAE